MNTKNILEQALKALLESETDDAGRPFDDRFDIEDITSGGVQYLEEALHGFLEAAANDLAGLSDGFIGQNYTLTANRHGGGFWDAGLGDRGRRLTELCHGASFHLQETHDGLEIV